MLLFGAFGVAVIAAIAISGSDDNGGGVQVVVPVATVTPMPTYTPYPTATTRPTDTPMAAATPKSTYTSYPTPLRPTVAEQSPR